MSAAVTGTGIFKNNIVTKLLNFVKSLLGSILHYANCKKSFLKNLNKFLDIKNKIWKFQMNNQNNEKIKDQKKRELYKDVNLTKIKLNWYILFKKAIQFFSKNSAHIEAVRNDELERVHFFLLPCCHYLPKETKVDFHDKVNRASVKSKVTDLVDHSLKIIEIAKHEEMYNFKRKIKLN